MAGTTSLELEIINLHREGHGLDYVCQELFSKLERSDAISSAEINNVIHFLQLAGRFDLIKTLLVNSLRRSKFGVLPIGLMADLYLKVTAHAVLDSDIEFFENHIYQIVQDSTAIEETILNSEFLNSISLRAGLEQAVGKDAKILYAKGSNLDDNATLENNATLFGKTLHRDDRTKQNLLLEAIKIAKESDVIIAALGESAEMSGESSSRTNLEIPQTQKDLLQELLKLGKPVVLILFNGRPLVLNQEVATVPSILNVWFPGSEAGFAIADVIFGIENPSGKLTTTFPRSVGQIPIFYNHKNTGRPLGNSEGKFEK